MYFRFVVVVTVISLISESANGLIKRCYQCRSRGDLGSCKDPFRYNASSLDVHPGITAVPCASGWCGKVIEGESGAFREDDFDTATQRMCVQRGPDDSEDRCAHTTYNQKKVFMCFCQGDLCNHATTLRQEHSHLSYLLLVTLYAIKLLR